MTNSKRFLALTFLATTLVLSAAIPQTTFLSTKQQSSSISSQITSTLYKRGLDEETAKELSQKLVQDNDELLSLMINNLINNSSLTKNEIINYLSKQALLKKRVDLSSYSNVVKMAQTIKSNTLNSKDFKILETICARNEVLVTIFS